MHTSPKQLLEILDGIQGLPILVIGDLILDRYLWGTVDRISPEAPVPVVLVKQTEDRLGGAANAARNLRSLQAEVTVCGFVGDDEEAQSVLALLDRDGIKHEGVVVDRGRSTCLKTRVIAHSQQVVRIDRESSLVQGLALQEGFAAVIDSHIDGSKAIILSDYAKGVVSEPLLRKLEQAKESKRIGLGIRPLVVDPNPGNYDIYKSMTVSKPNRKEAEAATGKKITNRESALIAAETLLKRWHSDLVVLSLGEDGLLIAERDKEGVLLPTMAQQVYDVSGAGDTVTALFAAAMAAGASPTAAGELANIGAGIVVSEVGTVPVNLEKLRAEIERLKSKV